MKNQLSDLQEGEQVLKQVLSKTDGLMKKAFAETMEIIQEKFSANVQTAFGGGKAFLKFTDPADLLETGIEIIAQPPDKNCKILIYFQVGKRRFLLLRCFCHYATYQVLYMYWMRLIPLWMK